MKKRIAVLMLAFVFAMTAFAGCGGNKGNGVLINIMNTGGGIGRAWLDEAIERYTQENPHVAFNVSNSIQTGVATMASSTDNIYFTEDDGTVAELAAEGKLLCIDDIVTEKSQIRDGQNISIEDKIDAPYRDSLKFDDKYYALPHFVYFTGLTYDADLFDGKYFDSNKLYYIADYDLPDSDVVIKNKSFGEVRFVKDENTKKSVGPDGLPNTDDDGLPCNLIEFLALCEYLKESKTPFELTGKSNHYISYLIRGLWVSLSGYDVMSRTYSYDGEMEVVKRGDDDKFIYTEENLFPGIDYIKKPVTEIVTLTEQTGYKAYDNVNRYYAAAVVEILVREKYISTDASDNGITNIDAQSYFVNGVNEQFNYGMLIEGNYWYNEAVDNGVFKEYDKHNPGSPRRIKWLPLPTSFDTKITNEENKKEYALMDACGNSYAFVNANIMQEPELAEECKKFLQFLYTDAELSHFVGRTGVKKAALSFPILQEDKDKLSDFQNSVMSIAEKAKVIYSSGSNKTFRAHADQLYVKGGCSVLKPTAHGNYYDSIAKLNSTAKAIFEVTRFTKTNWEQNIYENS